MYEFITSVHFVIGTGVAVVLSVIGSFALESYEKVSKGFMVSAMVSALLFIFSGILSKREQNINNTLLNTKAVIVAINGSETYITQDKFLYPLAGSKGRVVCRIYGGVCRSCTCEITHGKGCK